MEDNKDLEVITILSQLGLRQDPEPDPELNRIVNRTEEDDFLDKVKEIFN